MGHKVNPKIFRIGLSENWSSRWFKHGPLFAKQLEQDTGMRKYLTSKLRECSLESVEIERSPDNINITLHSSKPGIIIGRGGSNIEEIKKYLQQKILKNRKIKMSINIKEVNKPQLSAPIMAQNISLELEKRIPYRRVMKRNIEVIMKAGAQGVKIACAGRLGGVEIARTEKLTQGKIPLHTLRASIDYGTATAKTTYGAIGVKVWIYKGEKFN
ncbi:30S ribosomal protein S3 [Patescibacteria group bacterium]|nr:30S ribosomal protein S3 [Patescibacteria group bacterium]